MPGPRTIHEVKAGGPSYQPYKGPQYYASKGYVPIAPVNNSDTQYYTNTTTLRKVNKTKVSPTFMVITLPHILS